MRAAVSTLGSLPLGGSRTRALADPPAQHLVFPVWPLPGFLAAPPASSCPSSGLSGLALFIQLGQRKQLL